MDGKERGMLSLKQENDYYKMENDFLIVLTQEEIKELKYSLLFDIEELENDIENETNESDKKELESEQEILLSILKKIIRQEETKEEVKTLQNEINDRINDLDLLKKF